MLEVVDLECARGERRLFSHLNFILRPGEIVHIRGPNGSGKTTLLRTLCGLNKPISGDIRWRGQSLAELAEDYYEALAYIGHRNGIKDDMTALENLQVASTMAGHRGAQAAAALEVWGLQGLQDLPVRVLSEGQRRRVTLARLALIKRPLWVLDEPFNALDVSSTHIMHQLLSEQVGAGGMAIFTAHQEVDVAGATVHHIQLAS